jgi:hypothetical protein
MSGTNWYSPSAWSCNLGAELRVAQRLAVTILTRAKTDDTPAICSSARIGNPICTGGKGGVPGSFMYPWTAGNRNINNSSGFWQCINGVAEKRRTKAPIVGIGFIRTVFWFSPDQPSLAASSFRTKALQLRLLH